MLTISSPSKAFLLDPYATLNPNLKTYDKHFSGVKPQSNTANGSSLIEPKNSSIEVSLEPKHEQHALDVINNINYKPSNKKAFIQDVISGVRWNDDPLRMTITHGKDFGLYFLYSCHTSKSIDPGWDLLHRTHCGDMQFLHAMASAEGETADETQQKMLMWLEFTYKVATGEIPTETKLVDITIDKQLVLAQKAQNAFQYFMTNSSCIRKELTSNKLFLNQYDRDFILLRFIKYIFRKSGEATELKPAGKYQCKSKSQEECVQNVALGSFIHLLQDSYSASHVKRNPSNGNIEIFGLYTEQNHSKHKTADEVDIDADMTQPNMLSRQLMEIITLALKTRDLNIDNIKPQSSWQEAEKLITCYILVLNNPKAPAGSIGYE